jgi:hypothetical protein
MKVSVSNVQKIQTVLATKEKRNVIRIATNVLNVYQIVLVGRIFVRQIVLTNW